LVVVVVVVVVMMLLLFLQIFKVPSCEVEDHEL